MGWSAAGALVVALMLVGCGGSTAGGFADSVSDQYCPQFVELVGHADALQDTSDLRAAAEGTRQYARIGEELADDLGGLDPPDHVESEWRTFVRELGTSARIQGTVIAALERGDTARLRELRFELSAAHNQYLESLQALEDAGITLQCPVQGQP